MDANNVCRKVKDTVFLLDPDLIFQNKALLQIQINNFSSFPLETYANNFVQIVFAF